MAPPVGARAARALEAARRAIAGHPGAFLVASALLALSAALYAASALRVHADIDSMISAELPHQQRWLDFSAQHPLLAHPLVVVVDGPRGEATRVAASLARDLRRRDDLFAAVSAPGSDPFFRRHGLLYLEHAELAELSDRLIAAQPLLAALAREPGLPALLAALDRALAQAPDDEQLAPLLDALARQLSGAEGGEAGELADRLLGDPRAGAAHREIVLALPRAVVEDGLEGLNPAREGIDAIHAAAADLGLGSGSATRVRVTGDLALSADELELLSANAWLTGAVSFALVTGLLALGLRDPRLVLAVCGALAVGLAWTAGFAALTVGRLNMISVAFAVMSIGLGVDFGIHLCARFRERLRRGALPGEALRVALRDTARPLFLCAATTALAFASFLPTDFTGLAEFGWISGGGILLSLLATLIVIPAALTVSRPRVQWRHPHRRGALDALLELPGRRPRAVLGAAGLGTAAALWLLPGLDFAGNPLSLRVPDSESASTFRDLLASEGDTTWNLHLGGRSREEALRLAAELEALPVVARATTLASFVPSGQEARRAELADLALLLGPLDVSGRSPGPEARLAAMRRFGAQLDCGDAAGPSRAAACRLRRALAARAAGAAASPAAAAALARDEQRLLDPLLRRIEELARALDPPPVTVASLPPALADLWRDGESWRVQVAPASALNDDADLVAFADGVRAIAPEATGMAVQVVESERVVVRSLATAFVLAALAIAGVLALYWRRAGDVARVMAPLALSALWLLGLSSALGLSLNFANVIVLPLILGIGIDSGVHMIERARSTRGTGELLRSSTARAILLSSLTTVASFGCLAFSPHPGMASMGRMLVLGLAITLLANLVFLPALLALRPAAARSGAAAPAAPRRYAPAEAS